MTTAKEFLKLIDLLQNTSGSNNKIAIVSSYKDTEFKDILFYTYREDVQYKVKTLPCIELASLDVYAKDNYKHILETLLRGVNNTTTVDFLTKELSKSNPHNLMLLQVILDRDLRIGLKAKSINKAFGELFITEFKPIKPRGTYHKDLLPLYLDFKHNGARVIVEKYKGQVIMKSSSGKAFNIDYIQEQLEYLLSPYDNIRLDGEVDGKPEEFGFTKGQYADDSTRLTTNGWINSTLASETKTLSDYDKIKKLRVKVFDIATLDEAYQDKPTKRLKGITTLLSTRVKNLNNLFKGLKLPNIFISELVKVSSDKKIRAMFKETVERGGEGYIWKKIDSEYHQGDTTDWGKLKNIAVVDLKIVGYELGKSRGKTEGLVASVWCESSDELLRVKVGSGLTHFDHKHLLENQEKHLGNIIQVTFTNLIDSKSKEQASLFLPRFTGGYDPLTNFEASLRPDKSEALTLAECKIAEKDCRLDLIFGEEL